MLEFGIIIILMIGIVLAIAIGQKPISDKNVETFDRHTTNALKGASILLVFIHHWGQLTSEVYYDHSFVGYLAVTVFLFIAGYVTQFQYQKRGGIRKLALYHGETSKNLPSIRFGGNILCGYWSPRDRNYN